MKKRSLFKNFVGGLAAAVGVRSLPVVKKSVVMPCYTVAVDWGRDVGQRGANNPVFSGGLMAVDYYKMIVLKARQKGTSEMRDQLMKVLERKGQA